MLGKVTVFRMLKSLRQKLEEKTLRGDAGRGGGGEGELAPQNAYRIKFSNSIVRYTFQRYMIWHTQAFTQLEIVGN